MTLNLRWESSVKTRIRNGVEELVPPGGGYFSHDGQHTECQSDWHDKHFSASKCPECGERCLCGKPAECVTAGGK